MRTPSDSVRASGSRVRPKITGQHTYWPPVEAAYKDRTNYLAKTRRPGSFCRAAERRER